jgi:hypothetical protein
MDTPNHITASSYSDSELVYSDSVGGVYIVSISISGLVSKRICIDAGIGLSIAFLEDNLITVFQDGSYSLNGNLIEESEKKVGCVLDSSDDFLLSRDLRGRYNVCKRGKEGEYVLGVKGRTEIDLSSLLNVWTWKIEEDLFVTASIAGSSLTFQCVDCGFARVGLEFGACIGVFSGYGYGVFVGTEKIVLFGRDLNEEMQEGISYSINDKVSSWDSENDIVLASSCERLIFVCSQHTLSILEVVEREIRLIQVVDLSKHEPSCVYAFSDRCSYTAIISTYTSLMLVVREGSLRSSLSLSCPGIAIGNSIIELRDDSGLYILSGIIPSVL